MKARESRAMHGKVSLTRLVWHGNHPGTARCHLLRGILTPKTGSKISLCIIETHVSLSVHSHILSLSKHYPALIHRISHAHECSHLFLQICVRVPGHMHAYAPHITTHLSIHPCPTGVYWCIFSYYSLLSNLCLALCIHCCASHVYDLLLHIFMTIPSLLGSHPWACGPSTTLSFIYNLHTCFIFLVDFPPAYPLCVVAKTLNLFSSHHCILHKLVL
jgi:hypothetical protein